MLSQSRIQKWVGDPTCFARGWAYARQGRVLDLTRTREGETLCLAAHVQGTARYGVSVRYEEKRLLACACSCPAFARTGAMCKHVAALLIESWMQEELEQRDAARREAARRAAEEQERERKLLQQSFVEELLEREARRRGGRVQRRHAATGDVRLWPVLRVQDGEVGLELRIGRTRMYAVRSMAGFRAAALQGLQEVYGRELTFMHEEAQLAPDDRALYRQVVALAGRKDGVRGGRLALEGAALDVLMHLLLGRECGLRVGEEAEACVRVVEGVGKVEGRLERERGGVRLTLCAPSCALGERGAYFFCPREGEVRCALGERFAQMEPLLRIAQRWPDGLSLDKTQVQAVCEQLLVPAGDALALTRGREYLIENTPMAMRPRFFVDMEEALTCRVEYDYGTAVLRDGQDNPHIRRDWMAEEEARAAAMRLFPKKVQPGVYAFEGDEEEMFALLCERLSELQRDGEVMVAERLTQRNRQARRTMTFGVSRSDGQLLLRADLGGLSQPELEAAYRAYRQKRRFVRLKDGTFLSGEALEQAAQAAQMLRALGLTAEELARGANLPLNRAMYLEAALAERPSMELNAPGEIEDFVRRLRRAREAQAQAPKTLLAELRPYQLAGYGWLCAMEGAGFGGILADDMGLGKTVQALALLLHAKEAGETLRALVVCPASLQLNWLMEAQRFAPGLTCVMLEGPSARRRAAIAAGAEVLITSYDQLRRDTQAYHGIAFSHVLLDEAQRIKNAASQGARAVKALSARSRFALTGTPVENQLSELWSIFDFLMPGYLLPYPRFRERFEVPVVQEGDEQALQSLRQLVSPFILRRLKKEVLEDLPEKVETVIGCEMTAQQRRVYAAHAAKLTGELDGAMESAQRRMQILAGLTRLRQLCCDPALCLEGYDGGSGKLEQCLELAADAARGGHRMLLFSQFTTMLARLRTRLEAQGLRTFTLTGETDKQERMRLVERFNAGEADVFLISLKAGGTGLNLTGANVVIHYDPWWNTSAQNQATDRAHRIGQTRGVQVFKLIASGSIEERMMRMQQQKAELSEGILAGEATMLDARTLRELLG